MQESMSFQEVSAGGWHYAGYCCSSLIFFFSMSPQTTSMQNRYNGSRQHLSNTMAQLSVSLTTGIFSIMLPDGFWNLTGVKAYHGKGTIPPGLNRKQNDSNRKRRE